MYSTKLHITYTEIKNLISP